MKIRLLSLNTHIWVKDLDPRDKKKWFVPRTIKMIKLFKKKMKVDEESEEKVPDIICLQERIWPMGKVLLGLWGYKTFATSASRLPIYVKRRFAKKHHVETLFLYNGTVDENGHGLNTIVLDGDDVKTFIIQNGHLSFDKAEIKSQIRHGFFARSIFCGDFNLTRDQFMKIYNECIGEDEGQKYCDINFFDKLPKGAPTYHSFDGKKTSDIDQIGYTKRENDKFHVTAKCIVLPDDLSDHYPVLADIEIKEC